MKGDLKNLLAGKLEPGNLIFSTNLTTLSATSLSFGFPSPSSNEVRLLPKRSCKLTNASRQCYVKPVRFPAILGYANLNGLQVKGKLKPCAQTKKDNRLL